MGYLLELLCILAELGASDRAISMLRNVPAASGQRSAHTSKERIEALGALAPVPGVHQEHTLAGPTTSSRG